MSSEAHIVTSHLDRPRGTPSDSYGILSAEYIADFLAVAYRTLNGCSQSQARENDRRPSRRWEIFKWHFMYGADYKIVAPKVRLSRGDVFHEIYVIEAQLGRAFAELLPYALFPVDEYFASGRAGVAALPAAG